MCLCPQLCEDLFQRTGQNTDPDLTYSVEVNTVSGSFLLTLNGL